MFIVPPAFWTVRTRVGTLTVAFVLVEVLSSRALLPYTQTVTDVFAVCPAFLANRLILGACTFAGVVVVQPACGAVGTRVRALAVAVLGVEVLSLGAVGPLTDTVTCVRVVFPAFLAGGLVLGAGALAGMLIVPPAFGAVGTRVGTLTVALLSIVILSFGAIFPVTDATTCGWAVLPPL